LSEINNVSEYFSSAAIAQPKSVDLNRERRPFISVHLRKSQLRSDEGEASGTICERPLGNSGMQGKNDYISGKVNAGSLALCDIRAKAETN
jgi:hypothetical protein